MFDSRWQSQATIDLQNHEFDLKEIVVETVISKGFDLEDSAVIDDIVCLNKNMGLEVDDEDVERLPEDYKRELSRVDVK